MLSNLLHLNPLQSGVMGLLHIGMNMMALLSLGRSLERSFGSLPFLLFTLVFLCVIGPMQVPLAAFL